MANQGIVNIGLKVDYEKSLKQLEQSFQSALRQISVDAKKTGFSSEITQQIQEINNKFDGFKRDFSNKFEEINKQKLDISKFSDYQSKMSKSISDITSLISSLQEKIGALSGSDIASGMIRQLDEFKESVSTTFPILRELSGLINTSLGGATGVDASELKQIKATLGEIKEARKEIYNVEGSFGKASDDDLFDTLSRQEELLVKQVETVRELKTELSTTSKGTSTFSTLEGELAKAQMAALKTASSIEELDAEIATRNLGAGMEDSTATLINSLDSMDVEVDKYVSHAQKMIQASADMEKSARQAQGTFSTFQIKNGVIHVPIEISSKDSNIKAQVEEAIAKAQSYAEGKAVIAKVKLVLDGDSSKGYKKNSDIAKQIENGQGKPTVDISKAIKRTYTQAVREAEKVANDSIKAIQDIFKNSPIKITIDKEAFISELSDMVNSSLGKVSSNTAGINVNSELEALVGNLQKVSESLSGGEGFKLGLDEAQINRITSAIENMANMIQRVFGVASDSDIAKQWGVIESKFSSAAGAEGKLLKSNKDHLAVIREIAIEYQKYLAMGGKNDFSALTNHTRTVKNLEQSYQELSKVAEEATRKQEQAVKPKTTAPKATAQDKEAIKSTTTANKNLETQAGKTSTALENEGKVAQSASEKFRKLAKEKGAAVVANRELAKAAKETADALEREAKARQAGAGKTPKNEEPTSFNRSELEGYIQLVLEASEGLDKFNIKKVALNEGGQLSITTEFKEANGEIKTFTANFDSVENILDLIISDTKNFAGVLEDAFNSGRFTISKRGEASSVTEQYKELLSTAKELNNIKIKIAGLDSQKNSDQISELVSKYYELFDVYRNLYSAVQDSPDFGKLPADAMSNIDGIFESAGQKIDEVQAKISDAQRNAMEGWQASAKKSLDDFEFKNQDNTYITQVKAQIDELRNSIANIDSKEALNEFNRKLGAIKTTLNDMPKDNRFGKLLDPSKTFANIGEVRDSAMSLLSTLGKVNEKSIKVGGTDKLTAEVRLANGEIHKMNVNLDSKGFARYVDAGIVQFGRLRSAAEGVFKGIASMMRIYISPTRFIQYFKQGLDKVKEMDTAITELRKVSDAPMSDISAYFDDAAESAKELGSSIKDMIGATADWARLGMKYCSVIW